MGGIFELTDIVWHNRVSPRCANGTHDVVEMSIDADDFGTIATCAAEMSVIIAELINRMRFDSRLHPFILFHSLFCLKARKDVGG